MQAGDAPARLDALKKVESWSQGEAVEKGGWAKMPCDRPWAEYGQMLGGYFDGHPWHEKVRITCEDTRHPATAHLEKSFEIVDEIYQFKEPYSRERLRVLLAALQQIELARAKLDQLRAYVELYRALGGGWSEQEIRQVIDAAHK